MKGLLRITWLLLWCCSQVHAATQEEDAHAAKALLTKALAYYQSNGDKAFAAFSRQGEFVDHDRYVFVVDTQGVLLASGGPSSALIGRDVSSCSGHLTNSILSAYLAFPTTTSRRTTFRSCLSLSSSSGRRRKW